MVTRDYPFKVYSCILQFLSIVRMHFVRHSSGFTHCRFISTG